jgi:hypothetical protein
VIRSVDAENLLTLYLGQPGALVFCVAVLERSHTETWAGCIVSLTTPARSSLSASRSCLVPELG